MISPLQCATSILRDHPELAEAVFDLFMCARGAHGVVFDLELDEVADYLYAKTPHGTKQRELYTKRRIEAAQPRQRSELLS